MPTTWVVSMHGYSMTESLTPSTDLLKFPRKIPPQNQKKCTIYWFCADGSPLAHDPAVKLFQLLMCNPPRLSEVINMSCGKWDGDGPLDELYMYGDPGFGHGMSGIFVAGNRWNSKTWHAGAQHHYSLGQFMKDWVGDGDTIFWLCCRVQS